MIFLYVFAIYALGWILTLVGVIIHNKAKSYDDFFKLKDPIDAKYSPGYEPTTLIDESVYIVFGWPFVWVFLVIAMFCRLILFIRESVGKAIYIMYDSTLKLIYFFLDRNQKLIEEKPISNKIILSQAKDYRSPSIRVCPHCKKEIEE